MNSQRLLTALVVCLLLLAAIARLYDLNADPPAYFADDSQDVTTDPGFLTYHARNLALFDKAEVFDHQTWPAFKYSAVSGVAYLVFSMTDTSRRSVGLVGVILSLAALAIFLIALALRQMTRNAALTAIFLCTSFLSWVYGRLPFAEHGMLLLASLVFLAYSLWFDFPWGKILVGVLIALAGMFGKSFGFLLLLGPALVIILEGRSNRVRDLLLLSVPATMTVALIQVSLYGNQSVLSFLWEHGAGEHGNPHGLSSIPAYFEGLIAFGRKGLHAYAPIESALTGLMLLWIILRVGNGRTLDRTEIFMSAWLVGTVLVISPFNYQPLRYHFPLIIPMAVLSSKWLADAHQMNIGEIGDRVLWLFGPLLLSVWYIIQYALVHPFNSELKFPEYYRTVWYSAIIAVPLTVMLLIFLKKRRFSVPRRLVTALCAVGIIITLVINGSRYVEWQKTKAYNIEEATRDLPSLLGADAVISGQYGTALAQGSELRCFPLFLTGDVERTVQTCRTYPITHLAVSSSIWSGYCQAAPLLKSAPIIGRFWLRDTPVFLIRIAESFGNPVAVRSEQSAFEQAVTFKALREFDSARACLDKFLTEHPGHKQGLLLSYELAFQSDPLNRAKDDVTQLASLYRTDFIAQIMAAIYFRWHTSQTDNAESAKLAEKYLSTAIAISPENEENLTMMYRHNPPNAPAIQ